MGVLDAIPGFTQAKLIATAVVAVGLFGSGFYTAWHYKSLEERASVADASVAVVNTTETQDGASAASSRTDAVEQVKIVTVTKTILKKVPVYVTKEADAKCVIPVGFVRLLDAAASGVPPVSDSSGKSNDDPAGTELSTVVGAAVEDFGTCRGTRQALIDLQKWVKEQRNVGN